MRFLLISLLLCCGLQAQAELKYEYPLRAKVLAAEDLYRAVPENTIVVQFQARFCIDKIASAGYKVERVEKRNVVFVKAVAQSSVDLTSGEPVYDCRALRLERLQIPLEVKEGDLEPLVISLNTNESLENTQQYLKMLPLGDPTFNADNLYYTFIVKTEVVKLECPDDPLIACMPHLAIEATVAMNNCNDEILSSSLDVKSVQLGPSSKSKSVVNAKVLVHDSGRELHCPSVPPIRTIRSGPLPVGISVVNPIINNL